MKERPNLVHISKDSPYYRMSYKGYISPSRLAMAEHLGRCIGSDEYIYFKDGDSFNLSIDNMMLVSHKELTKLQEIRRIDRRIMYLQSQKKVLESKLEEIQFRHTPCNCPQCIRSIEARRASYNT